MKRDYKTLFWILASLLVAFCACAVDPLYVGRFTGNGGGLTNLPFFTNGAKIYVDLVNGTPTGVRGRFDRPFNTLSNAVKVALAYDQIFVGPGTDYVAEVQMPMGSSLRGSGMGVTTIAYADSFRSAAWSNAISPVLAWSDNCRFSDFTVLSTNFAGNLNGSVPIGLWANQKGATNVILSRVQTMGASDLAMFHNTPDQAVQFKWYNSPIILGWDGFSGSFPTYTSTNDVYEFYGCDINISSNNFNQRAGIGESFIIGTAGRHRFVNCTFSADWTKGYLIFETCGTNEMINCRFPNVFGKAGSGNYVVRLSAGETNVLNVWGTMDPGLIDNGGSGAQVNYHDVVAPNQLATNTPVAGAFLHTDGSNSTWTTTGLPAVVPGTYSTVTTNGTAYAVNTFGVPAINDTNQICVVYIGSGTPQAASTGIYTNKAPGVYASYSTTQIYISNSVANGRWELWKTGVGAGMKMTNYNGLYTFQGNWSNVDGTTLPPTVLPVLTLFSTCRSNTVPPTPITWPASNTGWTNPLDVAIQVYIDNTGVTGTAVKKNTGAIYTNATATVGLPATMTISLQPGEFIIETYSGGTPTANYSPSP